MVLLLPVFHTWPLPNTCSCLIGTSRECIIGHLTHGRIRRVPKSPSHTRAARLPPVHHPPGAGDASSSPPPCLLHQAQPLEGPVRVFWGKSRLPATPAGTELESPSSSGGPAAWRATATLWPGRGQQAPLRHPSPGGWVQSRHGFAVLFSVKRLDLPILYALRVNIRAPIFHGLFKLLLQLQLGNDDVANSALLAGNVTPKWNGPKILKEKLHKKAVLLKAKYRLISIRSGSLYLTLESKTSSTQPYVLEILPYKSAIWINLCNVENILNDLLMRILYLWVSTPFLFTTVFACLHATRNDLHSPYWKL